MNKPNITRQEAEEYIRNSTANITAALNNYVKLGRLSRLEADKYIAVYTKPHNDSVKVISWRGYYKNSMGQPEKNDRGIYDDAVMIMAPNYFETFNGNTDPSRYEKGIGMILPGWHRYKPGKHGISGPKPYNAFRPATPDESIPGLRDGQFGIKKIITPNIHSGGDNSVNSKACQTIKKSQWMEFQPQLYKLLKLEGQRDFPYLLLENI